MFTKDLGLFNWNFKFDFLNCAILRKWLNAMKNISKTIYLIHTKLSQLFLAHNVVSCCEVQKVLISSHIPSFY